MYHVSDKLWSVAFDVVYGLKHVDDHVIISGVSDGSRRDSVGSVDTECRRVVLESVPGYTQHTVDATSTDTVSVSHTAAATPAVTQLYQVISS